MSSLDKVKEQIFVKTQGLWVVGQVFQPWKMNVSWVISPHTEGDVNEDRRMSRNTDLSLSLLSSPAQRWGTSG